MPDFDHVPWCPCRHSELSEGVTMFLCLSLCPCRRRSGPCTITRRRTRTRCPSRTGTPLSTCRPSTRAGCTARCREPAKPACCRPTTWRLCEPSLPRGWDSSRGAGTCPSGAGTPLPVQGHLSQFRDTSQLWDTSPSTSQPPQPQQKELQSKTHLEFSHPAILPLPDTPKCCLGFQTFHHYTASPKFHY